MRVTRFPVSTLCLATVCLAITVAGCGAPPAADVDAANAAVDKAAATDRVDQYAAESLKAAQDARVALDAEMQTQEGKWLKSYDKAKELAVTAKAAGDKAAADAVAGRETAEAAAAKVKADAAAARAKARLVPPRRVGGQIRPPRKVKDVPPVYPAIARSARVGGVVTIDATIGPDGTVIDATVKRSVPMLDRAALDAVLQWEYTPSLLNGVPVPVLVTVTINFTP